MGNCGSCVFLSTESSCTTTDPERQIEQGSTSSCRGPQDEIEVEHNYPSTGLQRQMEVGESSNEREPANVFDGITAEASSSPSTVMKKGPWDVFINHRGCDTKRNLASAIYHTLDLVGFHAFLDEKELDLGDSIPEEIEGAMCTAALHIAIFSKRYAESPWCLAELSFMLKTGTPILPVFYHVDPTDLRWVRKGKGCYASAFAQHEEKGRYSSSMLDDWKTTLERVSNLSGHVLNSNTGDEGMLLKTIVNSVLRVIKKEPLEVAKHPVGLDEMVENYERSRREYIENERHVEIVGIVGFGGSGKTTLATELYNRKISSFNRSSFVHDVRDAASKDALHAKQKKLLEDLRIKTVSFDNVREGKRILRKSLESVSVLVVLDDVDDEDQLNALLPSKERLGSGSVIIVTTREGEVLTKWGIASIYRMQPLQLLHAKQLFCWHVFSQPFPQEGFEDLVENCIAVCNGLPLSLKVIGGQLYGNRSKDYWVSQIDKIRRILPKEILQRLQVSYDALDEDEKEIFLDIACFFIGERRSKAIAVWDGSGWSGLYSWERLHKKCLVEVDEKEYIRMHDHLRDLGRKIATIHSPSRIWSQGQSMPIQKKMPIRGMMGRRDPMHMEMSKISNILVGLQLLHVAYDDLTQECRELSRDLLWLRWSEFKHRCIPPWLSLEKVRVLEFIKPQCLRTLWDDVQPPLELRELLIYDAYNLQSLPRSIGYLKHLKRLSLIQNSFSGMIVLSRLPEEFCGLQSLEHLDLQGCQYLSSLPNHFGDLVNLRHLDLSWCVSLEMLPMSFRQLTQLEYLSLFSCFELILEPDILKHITNLKVFNAAWCRKVDVLPQGIVNQASVTKLHLVWTSSLRELPASIGKLSKLEELIIDNCPFLTRLSTSLGNLSSLTTLELKSCRKLSEIPSVERLVSLKTFFVIDCPKIKKIEGLEYLMSLEKLFVSTHWMVPGIHSLGDTERLRMLKLKADNISAFQPCLKSIEIKKWPGETKICGRIFLGVESNLNSFTFPGLAVVDSFYHPESRWSLTCRTTESYQAAIVCFLVRSLDLEGAYAFYDEENCYNAVKLSEGEWIVMSIFPEVLSLLKDGGRSLQVSIEGANRYCGGKLEASGGWLIVGERGTVGKGFMHLFQTLCEVESMS